MIESRPIFVRTLLVSDLHLGCKHSRSQAAFEFMRQYQPESLYLVGDFLDAWKCDGRWHWDESCEAIIDQLNAWADAGTQIYYTPGNHDAFLRGEEGRSRLPVKFPDVPIADEFVFQTLGGWRFLVTHGDLFDSVECQAQWISKGCSVFYDSCLSLNRWVQEHFLGANRNPYGVCGVVKGRVKQCVKWISRYDRKIMQYAVDQSCDGVICGHIHIPALKHSTELLYGNTGDWVENCTGMVEHSDGSLELVRSYAKSQVLYLAPKNDQEPSLSARQAEWNGPNDRWSEQVVARS